LLASVGVGKYPDPVSDVWGTNGGCRYTVPFRIVPAFGKIKDDIGSAACKKTWHVFDEDESRLKDAQNTTELRPKPAVIFLSFPFSRKRNWLAGEPAADEVDLPVCFRCWREGSHVALSFDVWPVFFKYPLAVRINFNLPTALHSSPFKPKVEPTNTSEQRTKGKHDFFR